MSSEFKALLEKQLKEKIRQKANDKTSEEAYLIKAIKFFDLYNTGTVTYAQFFQALERIGLFYSFDELEPVLKTYDPEGRGLIDYVDFSNLIFKNEVLKPHQVKLTPEELMQDAAELLDYFRRTLAGKAGNGIISIMRIFSIVDKDRSGRVSLPEFSSIMKEFKIELSNAQINLIFKIFDVNQDGSVSYSEFLRGVKGTMNDFRSYLVGKAFDKLDTAQAGVVSIQEIVNNYKTAKHPAVLEGRKSDDQVLSEFLETFEIHHNLLVGNQEQRVTKDEFFAYYDNVSATIGDDEYFANVLDATWDISGSATQPTHGLVYTDKSKYGDQLNNAYQYKNLDPQDVKSPTLRSGLESSENPWHTITPYYQVENADRRSVASQHVKRKGRDHREIVGEESKDHETNRKITDTYSKHLEHTKIAIEKPRVAGTYTEKKNLDLALERFKAFIVQKGPRGIIGIKKQFKIYDDTANGTIEGADFQKGLQEYSVNLSQEDLCTLYNAFNVLGTTRLDYVSLLSQIVGDMNEFRSVRVEMAWRKIVVDQTGLLSWEHISKNFNANRHPGVKAGYITEEEVQHDFVETFTALHSVYHSFQLNQPVTKDEFFEYFRILSCTIPNDRVFEMIMIGVWNVDLREHDPKTGGIRANYDFDGSRSAWKYDFHRSIYGKMDNSPFEHHVEEKSNKIQRPKTCVTTEMPTAGVYSWPFAKKSTFESSVSCLGADGLLTKTGATTNDYSQNQYPAVDGQNVAANGNGMHSGHPELEAQVVHQAPTQQ